MTTYAFGAVARLSTTVKDAAGTLIDPVTISLTVQLPDGTTSAPLTPVHDSTGVYHRDYTPTQAGRHIARWTTTTPTGAQEESFDVAPQWAEAGLLSLTEAKQQLNIAADETDYDDEIQGFVRSVTAICERYVGSLARAIYVEKHRGGYGIALNRPPVLTLTSVDAVQTGGTSQTVADLDVDGETGIVQRLDGGYMCGPLRVTYVAGRTQIPPNVRQAALIILQHMWETQRGAMGGVRVGGADEVYDPRFGFSIPRRAQELLGDMMPGIA